MKFYVGIHQPADAKRLGRVFVSVNRLTGAKHRKSKFTTEPWIMDSGAFTTIAKHGGYPEPVSVYADHICRWAAPNLRAAVAQDYMCEPVMLARTGFAVVDHQRLTIERYDELMSKWTEGVTIMPVLQGYAPADYAAHVHAYGSRLAFGAWVGVGSVCKRNGDPGAVLGVLDAVHGVRPDLRLHGFGLKLTSLKDARIRNRLASADSMAWSYHARRNGGGQNDWRNALAMANRIDALEDSLAAVNDVNDHAENQTELEDRPAELVEVGRPRDLALDQRGAGLRLTKDSNPPRTTTESPCPKGSTRVPERARGNLGRIPR